MYTLDLSTRNVMPFNVSFERVLTAKRGDTLAEFVAGILAAEDRAAIIATMADEIAESFEAAESDRKMRGNARKIAAKNGRDKVTEFDAAEAQEFANDTEILAFTAVEILRNSTKATTSLNLPSVYEGDVAYDVRVVVTPRAYGKPARVIDPNLNNL